MSLSLIDLPTEVIAHIFSFVSHKKDRRNLALLCKKSLEIVRQQSKKHNHLDLTGKSKKTRLFQFEKRAEFPFQKLTLDGSHVEEYKSLWQRHGAEITQMTVECELSELGAFGRQLNELFPNVKALVHQVPAPRVFTVTDYNSNLKMLDSALELFPELKRLKLTIPSVHTQVQELKTLLDKWLLKLENITLRIESFMNYNLHLLDAFEGWTNEKLIFDYMNPSIPEDIEFLKRFFSIPRHIKTFEIVFAYIYDDANSVLDSNLSALIDQNAAIDRLIIPGYDYGLYKLEGLINARGVKEIAITGDVYTSFEVIRVTPEALLKVTEIEVDYNLHENVLWDNLFPNLRKLTLNRDVIGNLFVGNEELNFITNNCPFLEHFEITNLHATNGHAMANLTRLRSLEITFSPLLTDAFFDFGSQLPKMKSLSVSNVPNLTLAGVKSIVANCPQIESIKFDKCDQITEECIDVVAQKLFYIDRIEVIWTDPSLKSVHHQRLSLKRKYSEFDG